MHEQSFITPTTLVVKGSKIRHDSGLVVDPYRAVVRLRQSMTVKDVKGSTEYVAFVAGRQVTGEVVLYCKFEDKEKALQAIGLMQSNTTLTDSEIEYRPGKSIKGTLIIGDVSIDDGKNTDDVDVVVSCRFTGQMTGQGSALVETYTQSGTIVCDSGGNAKLKAAGSFRQTATIGYQDSRQDRFFKPFIVEGLDEDLVELHDVVKQVVDTLNSTNRNTYGPTNRTVFVHTGKGSWAGRGVVVGTLVYARGPTDCINANVSYSWGYRTKNKTIQTINVDSGDTCDTQGIGVTLRRRRKIRHPIVMIRVPAVWSASPGTQLDSMYGTINDASYTLPDRSHNAKQLRCDGGVAKYVDTPAGAFWFGFILFARDPDGWTSDRLTCIYYKRLELTGTQTVNGYTIEASSIDLDDYPTATWTALATLVPLCYS